MALSYNEYSSKSSETKIRLLTKESLEFSADLQNFIQDLNASTGQENAIQIYEVFQDLQKSWEDFTQDLAKSTKFHSQQKKLALKKIKDSAIEEKRILKFKQQIDTKENEYLNKEKELKNFLAQVKNIWNNDLKELEKNFNSQKTKKNEIKQEFNKKLKILEKEFLSTIVPEEKQIPNLNLKNLKPARSPAKLSIRSASSNKYEEDLISNRSAFSHRSSSSKPRPQIKQLNLLPPIPPSQNVSEEMISKGLETLIEEYSQQQEGNSHVGISMEKSMGSWKSEYDSEDSICVQISPDEIKQAISILKKANLFNANLNPMLMKLAEMIRDNDTEKIELMYQLIYIESKKYKGSSQKAKEPKSSRGKPPARISNWRKRMHIHNESDTNDEMTGTAPKNIAVLPADQELLHTILSSENPLSARAREEMLAESIGKGQEEWKNSRHVKLEDLINAGSATQEVEMMFKGNETPKIDTDSKKHQVNLNFPSKLDSQEYKQNTVDIENQGEFITEFSPSGMASPASGMKIQSTSKKHTSSEYQSTGIASTKDASGLKSKITLKTAISDSSQQLFVADSKGITTNI
ncbi:unnamed protein product [Blepharisma stoltei]|uniref:Uncharacterized protein n=1 Tax=Blepharisma stoltei TaxID=1481888 RepID=A0AAU9J630_9CILI|nr:unnamed protein product [Blepharisma stoltei]